MKTPEIIKNIDLLINEAYLASTKRQFGKYVKRVYYAGGTLCIDVMDEKRNSILLMVNISTESINISIKGEDDGCSILLSMESLKKAFEMYIRTKGVTFYYQECFDNSCLKHLYTPELTKLP